MKKLICGVLAVMLVWILPVKADAADNGKNQKSIGVYAKYVRNVQGEYSEPVSDDGAQVDMGDGTVIHISRVPETAKMLVVYPFKKSETEAWQWTEKCLDGKASVKQPYEIYFRTESGAKINLDDVLVTIETDTEDGLCVFAVSTSGRALRLDSSIRNGKIRFTADGSRYYVLAEKTSSNRPTDPADEDGAGNSDSPRTGDLSHIGTWLTVMVLSESGLMLAVWIMRCRKKTNRR